MTHPNPGNQGGKTNEQQKHMLERKDDVPKTTEVIIADGTEVGATKTPNHPDARASEFSVSRAGWVRRAGSTTSTTIPARAGTSRRSTARPKRSSKLRI
jgi:hypothetical protein